MKTKFNPELLKEELKRYKLLSEYDFYQEKKEIPEYKDLILGDIDEDDAPADLEPTDGNDDPNAAADDVANDLGVDGNEGGEGEGDEMTGDIPEPDAETQPEPETAPEVAPEPEAPASDDVEVDVTSLVKGSEEAKHAADIASHNSEVLLQKLADLENRVAGMAKIGQKMDDLEKEIVKRNPTPVEKLEMRSLSSYPYSQKLSDYWADKEGAYDVMNQEKKEEYVLTKNNVDDGYSDTNVKKSFSVTPSEYEEEDTNPYEEEEI